MKTYILLIIIDKTRARNRTQAETECSGREEVNQGHNGEARTRAQGVRDATQARVQGQQGALEKGTQHGRRHAQETAGCHATVCTIFNMILHTYTLLDIRVYMADTFKYMV